MEIHNLEISVGDCAIRVGSVVLERKDHLVLAVDGRVFEIKNNGKSIGKPNTSKLGSNCKCLNAEELQLCKDNRKIQAIQSYRDRIPCSLKKAKDDVECDMLRNGIPLTCNRY